MNVSAIIMAAGLSRRMNQNKLKMKINNKYIYEYILSTIDICRDFFSEVIVVAKDEDILIKAEELKFKTVKNELSHQGQSISIILGIQNAIKADGYMFFVADQPFIRQDTIKELVREFEKNPNSIIMPCYNGVNGSPVIFPEMFKEYLLNLEGDTGGKIIIKGNPNKVMKVQIKTEDEFIDIDTMEDYNKVKKRVSD